jgi:glutathione peroxidase
MTVYDFKARTIDGREISLADYKGRVLLIVNVASRCGFTPQYEGLEELHERFGKHGFEVLGFPCNQFRKQEPGSDSEIRSFCDLQYGVRFPLFSKIDVNGPRAHPLYEFLKESKRGFLGTRRIKWNFTKFLIDRQGKPIKRYSPQTTPASIEKDIAAALENRGQTTRFPISG